MSTTSTPDSLSDLKAPSLEALEVLTRAAFDDLPVAFRALCGDVLIHVTDFPEDEVLTEMEAETPFDLLGLFTGIGLAQGASVAETGQMPNTVHLYRRPILDYWAEHDETLGAIVSHVLVHEIGHHFGLSDADMEAIEGKAG
ncbi:MAG: metallopeptidase family protein [Bosea sp. (in: a-proteobacteria)]